MDTLTPEVITGMLAVKTAPMQGPGRAWLDDLAKVITEGINRLDPCEDIEEAAENTVPDNTWEMWQVFTDLQLWEWVAFSGETVVTQNLGGLPRVFLSQFAAQAATLLHDEHVRSQ